MLGLMDIKTLDAFSARRCNDGMARKGTVTVCLSHAELVSAIREYAAHRGASLPSGIDQLKTSKYGASLRIVHDLDAWEADGYCSLD